MFLSLVQTLDLTDPKTFRDLALPMGAQSPKRLDQFVERYKHFEDPMGTVHVHVDHVQCTCRLRSS